MKKLLVMILCIMLALVTVACSKTEKAPEADDATAADDTVEENDTEAEGTDSDIAEQVLEVVMGGKSYEITVPCPANSVVITELPEAAEDGATELTPEEQEILALYESVEPLYVSAPMVVCDEYVMTWGYDTYDYPYHAANMEEYFAAMQENGVKNLELTEINGQKAILQDFENMYIVRVATEDPDRYVEFEFTPNDPEALAEAGGNMIASPYIDVAREFIESDLLKTICEGIQIKQK